MSNCWLFFWSLAAHTFVEILQPEWLARGKAARALDMMSHCLTTTAAACLPLAVAGCLSPWQAAWLFITHWLIDWMKTRFSDRAWYRSLDVPDTIAHWSAIGFAVFRMGA